MLSQDIIKFSDTKTYKNTYLVFYLREFFFNFTYIPITITYLVIYLSFMGTLEVFVTKPLIVFLKFCRLQTSLNLLRILFLFLARRPGFISISITNKNKWVMEAWSMIFSLLRKIIIKISYSYLIFMPNIQWKHETNLPFWGRGK